jgi:solute carrier family 8 (sodium/calcium exchanger)
MTVPESIGEVSIKVMRSSGARGAVRVPYKTIDESAKGNGKDYFNVEGELFYDNDETEETIDVTIINHQEYERNQTFRVELGVPYSVDSESGDRIPLPENKDEETMTAEERIAILGQPRLGEQFQLSCNIRESVEFKGVVDQLLKKANMSLVVGTSSWREQFIDAVSVNAGDDDDDDNGAEGKEAKKPSCGDYVMHSLSFFWKVLFAFVPPTDYLGGWAAFCVSILIIGFLTAIIGDVASAFGCTVGLQDAVTALSFVALGTSIPDTFASKVAALHDDYADSSVGNVTGSNAVNVFLGIGIAWSIAAFYHAYYGNPFKVPAGSLGFSVTMFCACSVICIGILLIRRLKPIHGELGGPAIPKYATAIILFGLWIFYVLMSSLESYCHITGF